MQQTHWRRTILFTGGWVLVAFVFSGLLYFSNSLVRGAERPVTWMNVYLWQTVIYAWALLSPLIILFAKRFRFERQYWWRVLPLHLAAAFIFLLFHAGIYIFFRQLLDSSLADSERTFFNRTWVTFLMNMPLDFSMYCFILSTIYVVDFYRSFQAEQVKSSELKAALANSQLQALKMQLHPHFLFNTLNSISALIHEDARAADQMVARLGDFLRLTLENSGELEVTFKQEMDFVDCYLEIEKVRFQERLDVRREISAETLSAEVPNLLLQPIIENAIRHGISRQTGVGHLAIRAQKVKDKLQIEIEDNGPGLAAHAGNGKVAKSGIGLANTRARLTHLYGAAEFRLEIKTAVSRGLIVLIEIPFKTKTQLTLHDEKAPAPAKAVIGAAAPLAATAAGAADQQKIIINETI
jgi:signal transduction histidine kinase